MVNVLLIAIILSTVFLINFAEKPATWLKTVVKTASVALLAVAAWGQPLLALALGLGASGDFFLSRPGKHTFTYGLASFLISHVVYIFLILPTSERLLWPLIIIVPFSAIMIWKLWFATGALRWPVICYIIVISMMCWLALSAPLMISLAALSFVASDTLLAVDLFLREPEARGRVSFARSLWAFYWGAQMMFYLAFQGH